VRPAGRDVDTVLAGGWIEVAHIVPPPGEVVVSMRPVSVSAKGLGSEIEQVRGDLHGQWRQATRAVMVLLSLHGLPPAQIAVLLDCHPATVRRWISRFNSEGLAGLADRPRCGRPRLGGRQLTRRIAALLARLGPRTLPRTQRYLGQPQISMRTLYRRVQLVAIWRRPKLTAVGPVRPGTPHLTAQHHHLMPQQQDLHVLGRLATAQQDQPAEHPGHEQVQQTDRHEPRSSPTRLIMPNRSSGACTEYWSSIRERLESGVRCPFERFEERRQRVTEQ